MVINRELLNVISGIKDTDELERLFRDLFTPAELDDLTLRWKLLKDLHRGIPQRKIAEKYRISLCKITRGSKVLKKKDGMVDKILNQIDDPGV
ncbi:MAG: Trp family transcriptional regulator [Desulfotignum sp.]|nr:Trp family transcriptional regulator [Desulfotignum sp.]